MTHDHSSIQARFRSMSQLSNAQLKADLYQLNQKNHRLEAELLLYLGELDQRRLYREEACSSAFGFCVTRMGYSEDVAYKRVGAARLLRQFPHIYALLAEGRIHLTALMLLKPHLSAENHQEWLAAACNKSKREVEMLVATRCPMPNAATSVRKLPPAKPTAMPTSASPASAPSAPERSVASPTTTATEATSRPTASEAAAFTDAAASSIANSSEAFVPTAAPTGATSRVGSAAQVAQVAQVVPLSSNTFRVTFTASEQLKQKLDRALELLSHRIPPSDLPALIERALDQLLEREQTRRYGAVPKRKPAASPQRDCPAKSQSEPVEQSLNLDCVSAKGETRSQNPQDPDPNWIVDDTSTGDDAATTTAPAKDGAKPSADSHSNHRRQPKAAVRRAVFERDAGQCTFVDREGRRCSERHFLEFDHIEAHALGGTETVANLRMRCKSHNIFEAERLFGQQRVKNAIAHARQRRTL